VRNRDDIFGLFHHTREPTDHIPAPAPRPDGVSGGPDIGNGQPLPGVGVTGMI
jgi:hypothetical protein